MRMYSVMPCIYTQSSGTVPLHLNRRGHALFSSCFAIAVRALQKVHLVWPKRAIFITFYYYLYSAQFKVIVT